MPPDLVLLRGVGHRSPPELTLPRAAATPPGAACRSLPVAATKSERERERDESERRARERREKIRLGRERGRG